MQLEFTGATTIQEVPIEIIDNTEHEPTETVQVSLSDISVVAPDGTISTPTPSTRVTLSRNPTQVVITDDDSELIIPVLLSLYVYSIYHDLGLVIDVRVNDTVSADPLFSVPISVSNEQLQALKVEKLSLCYEVHGQPGKWFNFVTDSCTSINAHYSTLTRYLNVINRVAIRTVDNNGQCVNIHVDVNQCAATVDDVTLSVMGQYSLGGVTVKRYQNRIRISVPNCADITLVVWVACEEHKILNPQTNGVLVAHMLKLVVMRGLNFGQSRAHGLLGKSYKKLDDK